MNSPEPFPISKKDVHQHCLILLQHKISALQSTLNDLRESAANETKSTAGDKHETALAMLQIEQENTKRQLQETLLQMKVVERINPESKAIQVGLGSLVKTGQGYFFMSVALGRMMVQNTKVIALSLQAPLGIKLCGMSVHQSVAINGVHYTIEMIC